MDKSPDAFRTISEVAEDLDLPQHVLRFWETRFSQIKPLKRGGGRRYYRPNDVDLLKGIRQLLYGEGYTIKGVQRILKSEGVRFVESLGRGEQVLERRFTDADDDGDSVSEHDRRQGTTGAHSGEDADYPALTPEAGHRESSHRAALDIGQLQAALEELKECQRLLDGLRETGELESEFSRR
ncbi:MAG TPA: MerR family transcriptional regulator [Saliniramus sp.]|nr:MerR family transcriptional regulator [Saliniramus sp.]